MNILTTQRKKLHLTDKNKELIDTIKNISKEGFTKAINGILDKIRFDCQHGETDLIELKKWVTGEIYREVEEEDNG